VHDVSRKYFIAPVPHRGCQIEVAVQSSHQFIPWACIWTETNQCGERWKK